MFFEKFLNYIKNCDSIYIMGHKHSDLDSLGAALGLYNILCEFTNKINIILNKEQSLAGNLLEYINNFLDLDKIILNNNINITPKSLLIILDTHSKDYLENYDIYKSFDKNNIIIIDHHEINTDKIIDYSLLIHDTSSSSTCEIVTELIKNININNKYNIKKWQAESLLSGIMLDTKNFVLNTSEKTFETAAYLKKYIKDNNFAIKKIFASSINIHKIKSKIIENSEIYDNYIISVCPENIIINNNFKDLKLACTQAADELLNIKNIEASFVIFQDNNNKGVGISSRSLGNINIYDIMKNLGGGGNNTMAATYIPNSNINIIKQKIINILNKL